MIHDNDDLWVHEYNAGNPKFKIDFPKNISKAKQRELLKLMVKQDEESDMYNFLPMSAKELKDRYEADLKFLQATCKHEKVSDWMPFYWAPAHYSHDVRSCEICWKVIETRGLPTLDFDEDTDH